MQCGLLVRNALSFNNTAHAVESFRLHHLDWLVAGLAWLFLLPISMGLCWRWCGIIRLLNLSHCLAVHCRVSTCRHKAFGCPFLFTTGLTVRTMPVRHILRNKFLERRRISSRVFSTRLSNNNNIGYPEAKGCCLLICSSSPFIPLI